MVSEHKTGPVFKTKIYNIYFSKLNMPDNNRKSKSPQSFPLILLIFKNAQRITY